MTEPRRLRMPGDRLLGGCVVLGVVAVGVLAPSAAAHPGAPAWSIPGVMSRIDGARVAIGRWSQPVQIESTLCSGEGQGRRWSGMRHWTHFTCTWTVFDRRRRVDRDVTFRVHTLKERRFLIDAAHFGSS